MCWRMILLYILPVQYISMICSMLDTCYSSYSRAKLQTAPYTRKGASEIKKERKLDVGRGKVAARGRGEGVLEVCAGLANAPSRHVSSTAPWSHHAYQNVRLQSMSLLCRVLCCGGVCLSCVLWFNRPRVAFASTKTRGIRLSYHAVYVCEGRCVRYSVICWCVVNCRLHMGTVLVRCADRMWRTGPRVANVATKDAPYCCGRVRHAFRCVRVVSSECFPEMC